MYEQFCRQRGRAVYKDKWPMHTKHTYALRCSHRYPSIRSAERLASIPIPTISHDRKLLSIIQQNELTRCSLSVSATGLRTHLLRIAAPLQRARRTHRIYRYCFYIEYSCGTTCRQNTTVMLLISYLLHVLSSSWHGYSSRHIRFLNGTSDPSTSDILRSAKH